MFFVKIAFIFLYFILNFSFVNCLHCSQCASIIVSFNQAIELPSKYEGKMIEAVACRARFHIDYLTHEIRLDLMNGDDPNRNVDINLTVRNKFVEPKTMNSDIIYQCKNSNDCAKLFYQTTIQ